VLADNVLKNSRLADGSDLDVSRRMVSKRAWVVISVLVVLMASLVVGLIETVPGIREQASLSLSRKADDFPELFFTEPGNLPTTYVLERPLQLGVGVSNDSLDGRTYSYAVVAQRTNNSVVSLLRSTVTIEAGATVLIPVSVKVPKGTNQLNFDLQSIPSLSIHILIHEAGT
jgi:hypothetical protein